MGKTMAPNVACELGIKCTHMCKEVDITFPVTINNLCTYAANPVLLHNTVVFLVAQSSQKPRPILANII